MPSRPDIRINPKPPEYRMPASQLRKQQPRIVLLVLTVIGILFMLLVAASIVRDAPNDPPPVESAMETPAAPEPDDVVATPAAPETEAATKNSIGATSSNLTGMVIANAQADLDAVRKDLDLSVYTRIEKHLRVMLAASTAIYNTLVASEVDQIDPDILINWIDAQDNGDAYRSLMITLYSSVISEMNTRQLNAIRSHNSDSNPLPSGSQGLQNSHNLIITRSAVLDLCSTLIMMQTDVTGGESRGVNEIKTRLEGLQSEKDHILRTIEKAHDLLVDLMLETALQLDTRKAYQEQFDRIKLSVGRIPETADRYERIAHHTDHSAELFLIRARLFPLAH